MKYLLIPVMFVIATTSLFAGAGVEKSGDELTPSQEPYVLDGVEVQEYQGEDLSSVNAFRENSIAGVQRVEIDSYRLVVDGFVASPLSLTYDEVLALDSYKKVVRLNCVEGWSANILWEGVLIKDILSQAGADMDKAKVLILYAEDGYSSSLPIDFYIDRNILLAYKMNDVTMPPQRGYPFQLVAEDKWGYKWVKWVNRIEVSEDEEYRGFWEKGGYNQKGDLSGPKREVN